ncbi:M48 family metallopeptidase [Epilithonimonas zeae]|uniref:M48 family metallopeptidase n=1 Tax=Epilithonimonas zeae TaxID=1416779 RepID=UPI00200EFA79|nr:M48 family metallopeptidase [Epilithonimonas zeae]UQB68769.1 M48 family metalloprotease [Epilithonimonas zeae]
MFVQVSSDFKRKTTSAIIAIILFIIVYILLFLSAITLTIGCIATGLWLISIKPMFFTVMIGIGLASLGILISYFLIKFLFKKHITDRSDLTEITRNDEPQLFQMIDEIVKEAGTDFPKKVYLAYDVNASVFYDSSFWSMFLPIKKNLIIGIGLVNACTKQELKAILAHEFGHFSQRSMKVGSYVYNVNQIIFNLVNEDESYRNTVQGWANASGYFALFAELAIKITQAIQWILRKMYSFVNIRHMALSREMEFHADEVAANIAGSIALEESLLRLDLAGNSYSSVIDFYNSKIEESQTSKNIYKEQNFVMNFLAKESELELKYDLPVVKISEAGLFNKSKLVIENQWASHPSTEDRVAKLQQLNIIKNSDNSSARTLFKNIDLTEEKLTSKIFSNVQYEKPKSKLDLNTFKNEFEKSYNKDTFDKIFNNYYDNKNPNQFDLNSSTPSENVSNFDDLFSKEKVELVYTLIALENDKNTISSIADKSFDIKTFDYDGRKYKAKEAKILIPKLDEQIKNLQEEITQNDINIYNYFLKLAKDKNQEFELIQSFSEYYDYNKNYGDKFSFFAELSKALDFVSTTTPFERITRNFLKLKPLETKLKQELQEIIQNPLLKEEISEQNRKDLEYYINNDLIYFNQNEYLNTNLQHLFFAVNSYHFYIARKFFLLKKDLLQKMASLKQS